MFFDPENRCLNILTCIYRYLCLVSVIRNPEAKDKRGLIDMNCRTFQDALNEVFSRSWEEGSAPQDGAPAEIK